MERSGEARAEPLGKEARGTLWSRVKPELVKARRVLVRCLLALVALELLLRIAAFVWFGFSPYYLLYGFPGLAGRIGISPWSVYDGGYFKFPPSYELRGAAGQGHETASTNSLGFRGPDFEPAKPAGTCRVVCLGGSSTFGFHNEDDETYPFYLEELLRERRPDARVEVLNAGFPYYNTGSIRALLEAELWDYSPDLLTIYSAYNDASWPLEVGWVERVLFWTQQKSILYLVLKQTVLTDVNVYRLQNELTRLRRRFSSDAARPFDPRALEAEQEAWARRYRANLEAIAAAAKQRGVPLVLVLQPVTTSNQNRGFTGLSYEAEYEAVLAKARAGEFLNPFDRRMLRHHRLVAEMRELAAREGLLVVDNIALCDANPGGLTSWVHLSAAANQRLAEALAAALEPLLPRATPGGDAGEGRQDAGSSAR